MFFATAVDLTLRTFYMEYRVLSSADLVRSFSIRLLLVRLVFFFYYFSLIISNINRSNEIIKKILCHNPSVLFNIIYKILKTVIVLIHNRSINSRTFSNNCNTHYYWIGNYIRICPTFLFILY